MTYCAAVNENGWYCVLEAGHADDHLSIDNTRLWHGTPGYPVHWPRPSREMPRPTDLGYTGDVCPCCTSTRMRRNGSCLVCEECGETTGCS